MTEIVKAELHRIDHNPPKLRCKWPSLRSTHGVRATGKTPEEQEQWD